MTHSSITIQITPESRPSLPSWMGEVAAFAQILSHTGILKAIEEQVRFARAHFDTYDLIDFAVVLIVEGDIDGISKCCNLGIRSPIKRSALPETGTIKMQGDTLFTSARIPVRKKCSAA